MFALSVVCAADVSGDYTYTVTNGEATITAYNGTETWVTIPSSLNGIPVVAIGGKAFEGNSTLTILTVTKTVASIGDGAFSGCEKLAALTINDFTLLVVYLVVF